MQRIIDVFSLAKVDLTFSKLDFWIFFFAVMVFFSLFQKKKLIRSIYLVFVSLFFYYKTSGLSVFILIFTLLTNYSFGLAIAKRAGKRAAKVLLTTAVVLNVLVLSYFKYAYFFTNSFNELFHTRYEVFNLFAYFQNGFNTVGEHSIFEKLLMPAGVSFFTFSSTAYIIDVYRKTVPPVKNLFHYSFFISFFPHLILGPIVRAKDFVPQIDQPYVLSKGDFGRAIFRILKGIMLKLILADYIAVHFVDRVVGSPDSYPGFVGMFAMIAYSMQIYGDFAGYTEMATGIARLMGFKLRDNFNRPYKSLNNAEFWRRWHISLGSWWKDYLYIPLGGNRTGGFASIFTITIIFVFLFFITGWYQIFYAYAAFLAIYALVIFLFPKWKKYIYRDINLLITMVVGGLWHNPNQNFVIWGLLNGLGLVVYNHWKKISPYEHSNSKIVRAWKIFFTFMFFTTTRIWFRVEGKDAPNEYFWRIVTKFQFSWDAFVLMCTSFAIPLILTALGLVLHWLPDKVEHRAAGLFAQQHIVVQALLSSAFIILIYQLIADTSKHFIYFVF